MIPPFLFELSKKLLFFKLPFCFQNERIVRKFIKLFHQHTNNMFDMRIKWLTRKVRSLFCLKDKTPYPSCIIIRVRVAVAKNMLAKHNAMLMMDGESTKTLITMGPSQLNIYETMLVINLNRQF